MAHALGIDVGSTNTKVALVADDGRLAATAERPIPTRRDGDVAEQDALALWQAVVDAVREAVTSAPAEARDVAAVGVCSQYSSIVPVDVAGNPVAPLVMYLDQRGTPHSWRIIDRHPNAFEIWLDRHGIPPVGGGLSLGHVLHLQHDRPAVHDATSTYLEVMDFVALRLTGLAAANQGTMFMSQLCDNRDLGVTRYDGELVAMSGVDSTKLPPLLPLDVPLGPVLPEVAAQLGIPSSATVHATMNDSHAGAFATGAFTPGRAGVAVGTTSVLLDTLDRKDLDLDHEVLSMPSPVPGTYLVWAENGIGGKALEHVLEQVLFADDELGGPGPADPFAGLDALLDRVPPTAGGVLFLPWLTGSLSPRANPSMRGAFLNLSLDTGRGHLVRAVVEGVCHNLAWLLPVVEAFTGRGIDEVAFSGGAARSAPWAQALADILDRPVVTLRAPASAAARAVALVALAREHGDDPLDVPARMGEDHRYHPDPGRVAAYRPLHEEFEAAFDALAPLAKARTG